MPTPKPEPPTNADDPEQSRRFIDMAREVGADEDPEAIDRAFGRVVKSDSVTPSAPPVHRGEKPTSS
jgi:hypothetical protein